MRRYIFKLAVAACAAAGMLMFAGPVQASSLTTSQIQSILSLLQSFGVSSATIAQVQNALTGAAVAAPPSATSTPSSNCPVFSGDLSRGHSDKHGNGKDDVAALQRFLSNASSTGYSAGVTGYFGPETEKGVKAWQATHGVPATGFVGPLTRAAIAHACNPSSHDDSVPSATHSSVSLSAQPTSGTAPLRVTFSTTGASSTQQYVLSYGDGSSSGAFAATSTLTHTYPKPGDYTATLSPYVACMYSTPRCEIAVMMLAQAHVRVIGTSTSTTTTPDIVSMEPASGVVGTRVTIGGSGFTGSNTVLFNSNVAANDVEAHPALFNCPMIPAGATSTTCGNYAQTLSFTVPVSMGPYCPTGQACPLYALQVRPGPYAVSVVNGNGTSATSTFTVASSSAQE